MLEGLTFDGLLLGVSSVCAIAVSRWLCIKGEYYFTKRIWIAFLFLGIFLIGFSLLLASRLLSAILSVWGFCFLWGIGEVIKQEERVARGWFPANPHRKRG